MSITYPPYGKGPGGISLSEEYNLDKEHAKKMKEMLAIYKMQAMAGQAPPNPLIQENKDLRGSLSRRKEQMTTLMEAIQRDLAAIRSKCKDCDCLKDMPSSDCPNMSMHKTMSALVHITMENMRD